MSKPKIYKFPNGAILIYKKRKICNATSIYSGFLAGHLYNDGFWGLPHLAEHMLFKGTNKRSYEDIMRDRTKITFLNARTNSYCLCTNFFESNRRIEECFEFASDVLLNTKLDEERLQTEIKVVLEERNKDINIDNKNIDYRHKKFFNSDDPVTNDFIFGTEEILKNITTQTISDFYKKHFVADKFIMVATTSLSFNKIKKLAQKYFISKLNESDFPSEIKQVIHYDYKDKENVNIIKNDETGVKFKISFSFNVDDYLNIEDDYNPLCLAHNLFYNENSFHNLTRKEGLSYNASSQFSTNGLNKVMLYNYYIQTSSIENVDRIFELINLSIKHIKKVGVSQEYIDDFIQNELIIEDKVLPIKYNSTTDYLLHDFIHHGKFFTKTRKEKIKKIKQVNQNDIKKYIDLLFNKKNKVFITFMGNFDETKIKSIKEYKKMIFKK